MFFSYGSLIIRNIMNAFLICKLSRKKNGVVFLTTNISFISFIQKLVLDILFENNFLDGETMTCMLGMMIHSVAFIHDPFIMMIALKMES